jgi:ABC-type dipeptide/oligopeptide/nickel transport system permease component
VRKFILGRLLQFPIILAVIYLFTFLMVWVVPGSPFEGERAFDPAKLQTLREQFKADRWYTFLGYYPMRIVTAGDFGPSMHQKGFSVNDLLRDKWKVSFSLGFVALGIAVVVGMTIGTLSAVRRDGIIDWAGMTLTLVGISVPAFVTAAVLVLVFVAHLRWFGLGELSTPMDYVLPSIALSLAPMAYIVRLQRASMLDVLGADYVRTARAKGLSKTRVIIKHCLRNAFVPVLSYLGPAAALTLTGSFVVERVFALNGLGQQFVESITNRDQTLILALVMVYSTLVLAFNLLVDLGYALVDPRIDVTAGRT